MGQIDCNIHENIATITIDNINKANCLSMDMVSQLATHINTINSRSDIQGIVLRGAGDRFFCAGADIKEWGQLSPDHMSRKWIRNGHRVFKSLRSSDIPVICVLNGHALGGGLELALMCDYRLSVDYAKIGLPETIVGTIPGWLASEQLSKLTSISVAKQMILFGETLTAEHAYQQGIINKVCSADMLDETIHNVILAIKKRSPYIGSVAKRLIHATYGIDSNDILHEFAVYLSGASKAGDEGKNAFIEKRPPDFPE